MALARLCVTLLRPCERVTPYITVSSRYIKTSSIMSKEQIEELQKNPFFDKYADKIAKLQKTSPEEFLCRLAAQEEAKKKKESEIAKPNDFSLPTQPKAVQSMNKSQDKTLERIMKVDLLADKTPEEIALVWTEYWKNKDAVSAVIPVETYNNMEKRFQEFNTFLFPLPRDQGYEFVMVQFLGHEAHFSTLINYQAHRENAPECLGMIHYTELAQSKGIVLMVGEYDKQVLGPKEAKCLADMVEIYYSRPNERKLELLTKFTKTPHLFHHMDIIDEMNTLSIEPATATN